jgi:sarcosine oxidase subunit gamma
MSGTAGIGLEMHLGGPRHRFGLKGPRAAGWLETHGIAVPAAPNTWTQAVADPGRGIPLLVARLGAAEFFLEDGAGATFLRDIEPPPESHPPGVYPVLRQDAAFVLGGAQVHDVLAQVCNVNFADLAIEARPVIMTTMIGVSVLVVPEATGGVRRYRIWCDPTFGVYLGESLEAIVIESGGIYRGVSE